MNKRTGFFVFLLLACVSLAACSSAGNRHTKTIEYDRELSYVSYDQHGFYLDGSYYYFMKECQDYFDFEGSTSFQDVMADNDYIYYTLAAGDYPQEGEVDTRSFYYFKTNLAGLTTEPIDKYQVASELTPPKYKVPEAFTDPLAWNNSYYKQHCPKLLQLQERYGAYASLCYDGSFEADGRTFLVYYMEYGGIGLMRNISPCYLFEYDPNSGDLYYVGIITSYNYDYNFHLLKK